MSVRSTAVPGPRDGRSARIRVYVTSGYSIPDLEKTDLSIIMSSDPLTSTTRPVTDAVVTVRVIKSFPHRTVKNMILPHVDLTAMTVGDLKELVRSEVQKQGGWKPYRSCITELDTLKIYTQPHATKTMNLIINMDNEHWMLNDELKKLVEYGFANETEVSFFNRVGYEEFKANPEEKWL